MPFLLLVSFHWVMLLFLLLVHSWHQQIILKPILPSYLSESEGIFWVVSVFVFPHRRIRITSQNPKFLEQQLTTEYLEKGKNVQNKEKE